MLCPPIMIYLPGVLSRVRKDLARLPHGGAQCAQYSHGQRPEAVIAELIPRRWGFSFFFKCGIVFIVKSMKVKELYMKCILLHGLGQSPSVWNETVNYIDRRFKILMPNVFQWLPENEACYAQLYQGLERYCEQFDEPIVLGGLSLGGILAMQYAIEHSENVRALILMRTQFSMPKKLLRFQNMLFRVLPNKVFEEMGLSKKNMISLCRSMISLDFQSSLKDIHCRVLVLCGKEDKANLSASIGLHAQLPNAELIIVDCAGHEINVDQPIELGRIIGSFCDRL